MTRIIALALTLLANTVSAGNLPDCYQRGLDPDRRIFIVEDATSPSMLALLKLLGTLEHERYLADSLFPIFEGNRATIHTTFSRLSEAPSRKIINEAFTTIAALDGVQVYCARYQPGET